MATVVQVWDSQEFGVNIVGKLYSDGSLYLTGSGAMHNFALSGSPVYDDARVEQVDIENNITTVGNYAFYQCSNLTEATIPGSITSMGQAAFGFCALDQLTIAHDYKINDFAFRSNPFATGVHIEVNLTDVVNMPFYKCTLGDRLTFEEGITLIPYSIAEDAGLTAVTIPNSVTTIAGYAFRDNPGLTAVTIPANVTSIGEASFRNCTGLTTITVPDATTEIKDGAFWGCTGLTEFTIGNSVASIGHDGIRACSNLENIYNHYDGNQTIGNNCFADTGANVTPKYAYCYSANTNFVSAMETEGFTVIYYDPVGAVNITAPIAGVSIAGIVPGQINTPVTGVSVYPTTATIDADEFLSLVETIAPSNASDQRVGWSSSNDAIATVSSSGIVTGIAEGTATITVTTTDGSFTADCTVTVEAHTYIPFTALEIYEKNLTSLVTTINNIEITDLTIEKELGGSHTMSFALPYDSTARTQITAGRYIKCEGQWYYPESINKVRGSDGNPFLAVNCTHIFFEIEYLRTSKDVEGYGTILKFLNELLIPYGITVTGKGAAHTIYSTERYVKYKKGITLMEAVKLIFRPFFATYRLDNLKIVVIPESGEMDYGGIEFNYSETNQAISKESDYSRVITRLYAEGGTPEGEDDPITYIADASEAVKALYRTEREQYINFSGVTVQANLNYLAERYIEHRQHPHKVYTLSVAELKHISNIADIFPGRNFEINIGQTVKVYDSEFGINVTTVLQRYSYKPLKKDELSTVVISEMKPYDITFMEPDLSGKPDTPDKFDDLLDWLGGDRSGYCIDLWGIISTHDPDPNLGEENCLWFKFDSETDYPPEQSGTGGSGGNWWET